MSEHLRLNLNLNPLALPLQHHRHPPMRTGMNGTPLLRATGTERPVHIPNGFLTDNPDGRRLAGDSFSSLDLHKFMMDGKVRAKELTMAKKYIARDPRTGKPIQMGHATTSDASYEPIQGPWCALHHADIMSLAEGTLEKREVRWKNNTLTMSKKDGVRALSHVSQSMILPAHALLLNAFEDGDPDVRIAALEVLPEFAVRRSNELFDWLSVLLDDEDPRVQSAASAALARAAPTFPSGVHSSLENELRHPDKQRSAAAWKGLDALGKTWPDVVADHVDTLLLEPDVTLRRRAAKMINAIVSRKTSAVWDLVSWALNDEDAQVRKTVAKSLPRLAKQDVRMGTMFAERAITDPDPDVRLSAIKTIEKLNRGHGRARDLILAGSRSTDIRVRRACIGLLPKLLDEAELRALVDDLLKTETDQQLVETLMQYRFDAMLEGTEDEKNAALSPALAVPDLDKEVLLAQGKRVGMAPSLPGLEAKSESNDDMKDPPNPPVNSSLDTRRPTQDELMGYNDDEDDFPPDEDDPYY